MKYSELKSYLELARWENESDDYHIKVYRNGYTVAEVGLWEHLWGFYKTSEIREQKIMRMSDKAHRGESPKI